MTFAYPLGLLGLIGIPVLIIIYIIKNKYTEQTVTSTYLWTLSERFLKRKNPLNRIVGIISLILQILTVVCIAFAIAGPQFVLEGAAEDYCFIIDGSGSMNIAYSGETTRLDEGVSRVSSMISSSATGSTYTIVYITDETDILCQSISDRSRAVGYLDGIKEAYTTISLSQAAVAAQNMFSENPALQIYFVTDKSYATLENVNLIDVSSDVENYAVSDISYTLSSGSLVVTGTAVSYTGKADMTINLKVDSLAVASTTVTGEENTPVEFTLTYPSTEFKYFEVTLDKSDALALDNSVIVYNVVYENSYKTLLVGDNTFFMEVMLAAVSYAQVDVLTTGRYNNQTGYDLYIFDNFLPDTLPTDGAVWINNPSGSIANSGFTVQQQVELSTSGGLTASTSTATLVRTLLSGLTGDDIQVKKYKKCSFTSSLTALMYYENDPVIFTGLNKYGNREVVFAFDVHDSNFPLLTDFMILCSNLLDYTFPTAIDNTLYECGDTLTVNVLTNTDSIRVVSPSGTITYLDVTNEISECVLTEVGTYSVTMVVGGSERTFSIYSAFIPEESDPNVTSTDSFIISGTPSSERRDGVYDDLLYLFIILAVIVLADWMVYCYEQYQLR